MNVTKIIITKTTVKLYHGNLYHKEYTVNIPGEFGNGYDFDIPFGESKYGEYLMSHAKTIVGEVNKLRQTDKQFKDITRLIKRNKARDVNELRQTIDENGISLICKN
jgi:hypothetical protein